MLESLCRQGAFASSSYSSWVSWNWPRIIKKSPSPCYTCNSAFSSIPKETSFASSNFLPSPIISQTWTAFNQCIHPCAYGHTGAGTAAQDTTYGHGVNSTVLQNWAIPGKPWERLHHTGQDCSSKTASSTKTGGSNLLLPQLYIK